MNVLSGGRTDNFLANSKHTRVNARTDGVGHDLAGKVDFNAGIDGSDARVLSDNRRFVDVTDVHHDCNTNQT